jgi:hypothetical protein
MCSEWSEQQNITGQSAVPIIYSGSCIGYVTENKERWCSHKSWNTNVCCAVHPSDCCRVSTMKVVFTSIGSSFMFVALVVLAPFILCTLRKWFAPFCIKASHYTSQFKTRSNYIPHSSAAIARMKEQNQTPSRSICVRVPYSTAAVAQMKERDAQHKSGGSLFQMDDPYSISSTESCPVLSDNIVYPTSMSTKKVNQLDTLVFPNAISSEESKLEA